MPIQKVSDQFFVGPQPTAADLEALKRAGVRTVVDFRPPTETRGANAALVQDAGLEYANIPVQVDTVSQAEVERFLEVVGQKPGPFLLHCGVGARAGAFYLIHEGRRHGWSGAEALAHGVQAGIDLRAAPKLAAFVESALRPAVPLAARR
ncbi:MAG TPA: protein tyrosine phosphatase family protein [Acidiferrobacteraceae bacterium]|nr:protein tyrosine phosphatase family protein [Acidiferrobacteraceae bacterium]